MHNFLQRILRGTLVIKFNKQDELKEYRLIILLGIGIILAIYFFKIVYVLNCSGSDGIAFQTELREGVALKIAEYLHDAENPFLITDELGRTYPAYMYGVLFPLLISPLFSLDVHYAILFAEFLCLIIEMIGVYLFARVNMMYQKHVSVVLGCIYGISL